jgi:hypothetical protein
MEEVDLTHTYIITEVHNGAPVLSVCPYCGITSAISPLIVSNYSVIVCMVCRARKRVACVVDLETKEYVGNYPDTAPADVCKSIENIRDHVKGKEIYWVYRVPLVKLEGVSPYPVSVFRPDGTVEMDDVMNFVANYYDDEGWEDDEDDMDPVVFIPGEWYDAASVYNLYEIGMKIPELHTPFQPIYFKCRGKEEIGHYFYCS